MACIVYQTQKFRKSALVMIEQANAIIREYQSAGYIITLRQLYYQFVARDLIANKLQEYKRLACVINDARLAGKIDWEAIEDRTRNLATVSAWNDPGHIIASAAASFQLNPWLYQKHYVEVWVEKEALASVVERACDPLRVPYFCCRGYTSQSEMHAAAMRLLGRIRSGKTPTIIHLGDHDPSGIDMSRDIQDRFDLFLGKYGVGGAVKVDRVALNMDQVEKYNPPPNPAKSTDSRFEGYLAEYGDESWELDALDPKTLNALITKEIKRHITDKGQWETTMAREQQGRDNLEKASDNWDNVEHFLESLDDEEV